MLTELLAHRYGADIGERIEKLYWKDELILSKVAKEIGMGLEVVRRIMYQCDIPTRDMRFKKGHDIWCKDLTVETDERLRKGVEKMTLTKRSRHYTSWCKDLTVETDERVRKLVEKMTLTKRSREYTSWIKGLTAETDERVRKATEKMILTKKGRHYTCWNKDLTVETDERLRKSIEKMRITTKGRHTSPATEFKKGDVNWNEGKTAATNAIVAKRAQGKKEWWAKEENRKSMMGENHPNWKGGPIQVKCDYCEKLVVKRRCEIEKNKHHFCSTECSVAWHSGERNPNWTGDIPSRYYPSEFNESLKELIRTRDGYKCQKCGCPEIEATRKLDIHHIDYNKKNCMPENLISLCRGCNTVVNVNRDHWTRHFKRKVKKMAKERPLQLHFRSSKMKKVEVS